MWILEKKVCPKEETKEAYDENEVLVKNYKEANNYREWNIIQY